MRARWLLWAPTSLWFAVALVIGVAPFPILSTPTERLIRVTASSFQYAPAGIAVNPGDRVTLELASADYVHGLWIDDYNLDLQAEAGQPARLTFVADRPGVFRFRCSVTCGPLHPFMIGKLQVGPNLLGWRAIGLTVWVLVTLLRTFRR